MLGAARLIGRMDTSQTPTAVPRRPLAFGVRDVTTLDLDDCSTSRRRQQDEVDLNVTCLPIAKAQSVDQDLAILETGPQRLPHHALGLGLEDRAFWNRHTPACHMKTLPMNQNPDRMLQQPRCPDPRGRRGCPLIVN